MIDPRTRFTNRADDYARYRPSYPVALVACLRESYGLVPGGSVADIGSGTGIFSQLLLDAGVQVFAIEPNADMRRTAEARLGEHPQFVSIDATAEETCLPDQSVDLICAAQAFHWFDVPRVRVEFPRILRPGGWIALLWNTRDREDPMQQEYDQLTTAYRARANDFANALRREEGDRQRFFGGDYDNHQFPNEQRLSYEALLGRTRSLSSMPLAGEPLDEALQGDLRSIFERYASDGLVTIRAVTELFVGRIQP